MEIRRVKNIPMPSYRLYGGVQKGKEHTNALIQTLWWSPEGERTYQCLDTGSVVESRRGKNIPMFSYRLCGGDQKGKEHTNAFIQALWWRSEGERTYQCLHTGSVVESRRGKNIPIFSYRLCGGVQKGK